MSGSEVSEMDVDYQSEDGEIKIQKSPLGKEKQNEDILSFSLSEEEADDTADSLDIKPPQAAAIQSYKSRSHREKRSHRDKDRRAFGHSSHMSRGENLSGATSHKKSHHHSREHRERREERHREREKRHHRDKHNLSSDSKRDRVDYGVDERGRESTRNLHREDGVYRSSREDGHGSKPAVIERVGYSESRARDVRDNRDSRESREVREIRESREAREFRDHRESREPRESREVRDHRESRTRDENRSESRSDARAQDKVIEDLREQLIDKRRSDPDARDRTRERDRRSRKRDRREAERFLQQSQEEQQQTQAAQPPSQASEQAEKEEEKIPVPKEPPMKKAEKVERDMRRERLLEASREMDRQKEVYRRDLEARRARRHLEEEKVRTLESIAQKRERSRSRERKRRRGEGDEDMDEDDVEKGDSDDSVKEVLIDVKTKSPKSGDRTSDDDGSDSSSAGSTEDGEDSGTDSGGGRTAERVSDDDLPHRNGTDDHDNDLHHSASDTDTELNHPDENGKQASPAASPPPSPPPPSPPPPVDPFEGLPHYLPAIQGCRSVEEFQCLNRIEEGTYGVVYRARDKRTDEIVALKRLKMEKEKEGFPITSLREINTLLKAQHKNIVTVREIVVGSNMDKIFIVMDYVEHDLKSLMETMRHKKQAFSAGEVKCLMNQLLKAVNHLHDNWILHRDLKTSNLLLSHKGVLKVGDFGLAREYGSPLKAYTPIVVTLWYRSPELLLCTKEYSTPVDMWSVGCIYAEFLLMEALFPGKSEIDQLNRIFKELGTPNDRQWPGFSKMPAVQKMNFADYPVNQLRNRFGAVSSEVGIDFLNKFLTYDPSKRTTAEDALDHQYFKESPVAIDPQMFPTWPAKSELGHRKAAAASPKPPSGGKEYKQLGEGDEDVPIGGFHMGGTGLERSRVAVGAGFSLKF